MKIIDKNLNDNKIEKICTILLFSIALLLILLSVFHQDGLISLLFYSSFIITLFFWIYELVKKKLEITDYLCFIIVVVSILNVLINLSLNGGMLTLNYLKKYIMFSTTIIFFSIMIKINFSDSTKKTLLFLNVITVVLMIIVYFIFREKMYLYNNQITKYLTFGLNNPNITSIYLLAMNLYLILLFIYQKNFLFKNLIGICVLIFTYFIYITGSRNTLISIIVAIIIFIFMKFMYKKQIVRVPKILNFLIAVFPIVFLIVYLKLINTSFVNDVFGFLISTGKELNSRENVWLFALKEWKNSPIIGAYWEISVLSDIYQVHNTHLEVLSSYGIIVLICVIIFLYVILEKITSKIYNIKNLFSCIFFMILISLGIGEAIMFSGGLGFYILSGCVLGYSNKNLQ